MVDDLKIREAVKRAAHERLCHGAGVEKDSSKDAGITEAAARPKPLSVTGSVSHVEVRTSAYFMAA